MIVLSVFTFDTPVSPRKRTLVFLGLYSDQIYFWLHCLKEMCGQVQYCVHYFSHNLWSMYEPHWTLTFALSLRNLYLLRFHHLTIFLAWNWELTKFCWFLCLLNHFHRDTLPLVFHHFQFDCKGLICWSSSHYILKKSLIN